MQALFSYLQKEDLNLHMLKKEAEASFLQTNSQTD